MAAGFPFSVQFSFLLSRTSSSCPVQNQERFSCNCAVGERSISHGLRFSSVLGSAPIGEVPLFTFWSPKRRAAEVPENHEHVILCALLSTSRPRDKRNTHAHTPQKFVFREICIFSPEALNCPTEEYPIVNAFTKHELLRAQASNSQRLRNEQI